MQPGSIGDLNADRGSLAGHRPDRPS